MCVFVLNEAIAWWYETKQKRQHLFDYSISIYSSFKCVVTFILSAWIDLYNYKHNRKKKQLKEFGNYLERDFSLFLSFTCGQSTSESLFFAVLLFILIEFSTKMLKIWVFWFSFIYQFESLWNYFTLPSWNQFLNFVIIITI